MRKKVFLTKFLLIVALFCSAQDLIYNPSFEEGAVPTRAGEIFLATHWSANPCIYGGFDPGRGESPDLYDKTAGGLLAPPLSFAGGINPHTGNRLVALTGNFADNGFIQNTQEMIKGKLVCNLKEGIYQVSFWARPDARYAQYPTIFNYQHNRIEVVLLQAAGCDNELVVFTSSAINSLTSWVKYSGSFTLTASQAAKGYSRIAFRHITTGAPSPNAINRREAKFEKTVFMDDVSLTGGTDMIFPPETHYVCEGNSITIPNRCLSGDITITPMVGVEFLPPNPNWGEPNVGEIKFTPTQSTTYTINCKNGDCLKQGFVTIYVNPTPTQTRLVNLKCGESFALNDLCPGYTLDSYNFQNLSSSAPCDLSTDPGFVYSGASASITFNTKCSRVYDFVFRDANGCQCKVKVFVTVDPFVLQQITQVEICKGGEYIFNSPCSTSISLILPDTLPLDSGEVTHLPGNKVSFKPKSTTKYLIFCTGNGIDPCIPVYELTVNIIEPEIFPDEVTTIMCGEQAPLYPIYCPEGMSYIMTDPPTPFPENVVHFIYPKASTEITIACKDANGCIRRVKKVKITVEYPLIQHEAYSVCEGTELTLPNPCDGGTIHKIEPAVSYTTQGNNVIITPVTSGPYKIYCMDANGCLSIHEYLIDVLPPSIVEHEAFTICYLQSLTIQNPCIGGEITKIEPLADYDIIGGQIVLQPILNEGEYSIYCKDANGCVTIHKYHINYVPPTSVGYLVPLCPLQPLIVDLPCPEGNIAKITPSVPYLVNGSMLTITADHEGLYKVHCVDANGCETVHEYLVEWIEPTYVGHEAYTICEGGSISLEIPCSAGVVEKIEPNVPFILENGMITFSPGESGYYNIYCKDANGCITIHSYQIDIEHPIDYEHKIICIGESFENIIPKPEGCLNGIWMLNGLTIDPNEDGSITPTTLGTYIYKCKDNSGCVTKNYYFDLINTEPCIPKTTSGKKICVEDLPLQGDNTFIVVDGVQYFVYFLSYSCPPPAQNTTPVWTCSGLFTGPAFHQPTGSGNAYVYVPAGLSNGHHWTYTVKCYDDSGNLISETTYYIYKCGTPETQYLVKKTAQPQNETNVSLLVSPNPSEGEFKVEISEGKKKASLTKDVHIHIIDALGRQVVDRYASIAEIDKGSVDISMPEYSANGVYYLQILFKGQVYNKKISLIK